MYDWWIASNCLYCMVEQLDTCAMFGPDKGKQPVNRILIVYVNRLQINTKTGSDSWEAFRDERPFLTTQRAAQLNLRICIAIFSTRAVIVTVTVPQQVESSA